MISQVAPYEIFRYDKYEVPTESPLPLEDHEDQIIEQMVGRDLQSSDPKVKVRENWSRDLIKRWLASSVKGKTGPCLWSVSYVVLCKLTH